VLVSRGTNLATPTVQLLSEVDGVQSTAKNKTISLPLTTLELQLEADPFNGVVTGYYSLNGGARALVGSFTPPAAFFSADAAGIDPTIGTNTFGGVFATHRSGADPLTYSFDSLSLTDITAQAPPPPESFPFTRVATGAVIKNPTGMAFAPNGKLYVNELLGKLHELTIDPTTHMVTNDNVYTPIGTRLTIGIAVDPASTPSNTILWISHSDPDLAGPDPTTGLGGGAWDSSMVSKLSGANFATRTDVITGLPRSQANHTLNSIHFGPDGKLYLAQAGNTGAGAPNHSAENLGEFGIREEQRLSAAILVADVKAAGFDGSCATAEGSYRATPPCDVTTYSTGLRNAYDLVWHSNGSLYAPDNGASVGPTYPHQPTPDCSGFADPAANFDPGDQNDLLYRLLPGKYYGHPNPSRDECVFKDGSLQGVAPLPSYQAPIFDLGPKKSADGIIEYRNASVFGGALAGSLLITNYSLGDNITRVKLSADGQSVVSSQALTADTFSDPLPLVEGPDGTLYVGEFSGTKITALVPSGAPSPAGTWSTKAPLPVAILDAGGTELDGKLYFLAGKTSAGRRRTLYAYDPATNAWQQRASLPTAYPAVENPAVVAFNHKLYSFGGQTASFGSSVTNAAVYDPGTNAWTMLPAMPVARGGAAAEVIGTKAYLVGGFDTAGNSLASLSIYDLQAGTWSTGASMATRRDNPMSAVLTQGGSQKLFVFGGRTRNADGTVTTDILASVEMYDPATNTWTPRTAMPTARRTGVVGTLNGKAQVMGGERSTTASGTFAANEEYDPATDSWRSLASMLTPRHGAVAGTIGGFVYVAGGGPKTGAFYSAVNEAFSF
jgi:N-acetylneuraminic acid mutarotase/glucose/arabinose dehydrogenase